ncbi:hypothetical protein L207DRAFT_629273 [Hyaloscypha variabilis F]|uniref:RBR-type E3 ubiquitin transferase n=1 Tax=Hyaloscypha variabilis (strain UAMH 11265 / GT02V1 / F) TaxID=1149755 RepID=A0A2J6S7P0_HYAVF|nr:hypothetical protein L207DRAFT_629273 [Hyaloscypha variabilis F]
MANSESADGERMVRRRRRLDRVESQYGSGGGNERERDPAPEVRRSRGEGFENSNSSRRTTLDSKMTATTLPSSRSTMSRRGRHHHESPERKSHRGRKSAPRDEPVEYVYRAPEEKKRSSRVIVTETRRLGRDGESSEEEEEGATQPEPAREKRKVKVIYVSAEEARALKHKERTSRSTREPSERPRPSDESLHRSASHRSRRLPVSEEPLSPPKRSTSSRYPPSSSRTSLRRSHTTSSHTRSTVAPSISSTANRRSSWLGGLWVTPAPPQVEPEKLITCLTCLSDDIPRSKSAKLKCGHRMCQSCLKRIFKLSVNDPQHMPPKCCTEDFIPLKHVDKLFDMEFKKTWNRKFVEYSTKNRIYCPAKRCGEWIKPANIHKEDGKKVGKCSRCKMKVCCLCNGKWHGTKDCPKDEETNRLLEAAKEAGWQRCYNCRTMVELKEGCNHMTCRCTAEFCMICGLKWKSCNCPWFNYEAVEADRLNHMQVPEDAEDEPDFQERPRRLRRPRPPTPTYHDEVNERRRQERADEELARRLQAMALDGEEGEEDYQGGIGDIHGIGNGAGHFMNEDYVRSQARNILTGNFDQATAAANYVMGVANARGVPPPPGPRRMEERYPVPRRPGRPPSPPPMLRRHTMREQVYNARARPAERVVPRRTRTDYESEAAVHAPVARAPEPSPPRPEPTPGVLAGLRGTKRGTNRVSAWRTHVYPHVEPEEGVISPPTEGY